VVQLVVVTHVNAKPKARSFLRISRHELLAIVVEIEVERITGIHVDQNHVGVTHRQLPETKLIFAICHVIRCRHPLKPALLMANRLDDLTVLRVYLRHLSEDVRRRQNLLWIKNQIVLFHFHALYFSGLDQIGQIDTQHIEQSFHRKMQGFDLLRVQANLAVWCSA
jgi:hypothetical protein